MDFSSINLADHQDIARQIIVEAVRQAIPGRREFQVLRNQIIKHQQAKIFHNLYFVKAYEDLVKEGKIERNEKFLSLIQKRRVRTMSGVAPVTVITKPWPCPGKCTYCPTDVRMPKSYLPSQPAAQRGFRQRFDPYSQVYVRLKALELEGHEVSKVELRILGGTWSAYPKAYQTWFVKRCLQGMNEYGKRKNLKFGISNLDQNSKFKIQDSTPFVRTVKTTVKSRYGVDVINRVIVKSLGNVTLERAIVENETASVRCIGINIETRPDWVTVDEIQQLRKLGVTKVELGVQTLDDRVQALTRRGHGVAETIQATQLLKDAGFKVGYHMMPNLPGATVDLDKKMIGELFTNSTYQPDYLKIYPCVVIPGTSLAVQYRRGDYKPYDDETLEEILLENLRSVPEWCRIDRVARDIPAEKIEAGSRVSNIRQLLEGKMKSNGMPCRDIRSREIGGLPFRREDVKLVRREYGGGRILRTIKTIKTMRKNPREIFLSFEDQRQDKLIALLRLRLSEKAIVREVHVYGKQIAVGTKGFEKKQHAGWGTQLMKEAELIAKKKRYSRLFVIAGIGTREWYRKLGYRLFQTYMVKFL